MPDWNQEFESIVEMKQQLRREFLVRRNAQSDKDALSEKAIKRLLATKQYQAARIVMWYIHCRSEVRTKQHVIEELANARESGSNRKIVVPYCADRKYNDIKLGLWHLESLDELIVGKWGILEPPASRWNDEKKNVHPGLLDLILVPGVSFDLNGGRLGNGQGYYDRLLSEVRPDCQLIGLCYETQLCEEIPLSSHDMLMDTIVTEKNVYACHGSQSPEDKPQHKT